MKKNKWDEYFSNYYHPVGETWGVRDVAKYSKWYFSWINYIERHCRIFQKRLRIFEIGSAIGAVAKLLHERDHMVVGSDISRKMVAIANDVCRPVPFIRCDIQMAIPSKTKFDVIMAFEVLEHIPKLKKALQNIRASLLPGGYFIGTSPYPYSKNYLDRTHVFVANPNVWKKLFLENGFTQVKTLPMSFLPVVWRLSKMTNPVLPFYIPLPFFVSTTLIIAKK